MMPTPDHVKKKSGFAPTRILTGATLAIALAAAALIGVPTAPAYAQAEPQNTWEFSDPSGAKWTVPDGVPQVWVGIRGGSGGVDSSHTSCTWGGRGEQFSVLLNVKKGDVITTYAGKQATGSGDQRIGGQGYLNGGDGGKRSLTASNGGGGGGAAAVKLNGELIAVAGGGGGCGGASAYIPNTDGTMRENVGGEAGFAANMQPTNGQPGTGRQPGKGGVAGTDSTSSPGYGKSGRNGSGGTTGSSGGGGGGGGAGFPASGSGGGGGHKFAGFSGGGGGGGGMSWVKPGVHKMRYTQPEDAHVHVPTPAAEANSTKITIPLTTTTQITAPKTVVSGEPVKLRVHTAATRSQTTPLEGRLQVFIDGVKHEAVNPGQPSNTDFTTSGDLNIDLPGLSAGSHTVQVKFAPTTQQQHWIKSAADSEKSVTIVAENPAPPVPDDDAKLNTVLDVKLPSGMKYGDSAGLEIALSHNGTPGKPLGAGTVSVKLNGAEIAASVVDPAAATHAHTVSLPPLLHAGPHRVSAEFTGSDLADAARTETLNFSVGLADTTTVLTAPATVAVGTPVQATAQVNSSLENIFGAVELLANGTVLTSAHVDYTGAASFPAVLVPPATTELTARYVGDSAWNIARSVSAAVPFTVTPAKTSTTLTLSETEIDATDELSFTVAVKNLTDSADPRGAIEIFFDEEVVLTIPVAANEDDVVGNSEAVYELTASGWDVGEHDVAARFVPAAGFLASESSETPELTVVGIEPDLEVEVDTNSGSLHPVIDVSVSGIESETMGGFVEVFVQEGTDVTALADVSNAEGQGRSGVEREIGLTQPEGYQLLGEPLVLEHSDGNFVLDMLPVGTHNMLLRFTADAAGHLPTTAEAVVTVAAAAPGALAPADPGAGVTPGAVADTGVTSAQPQQLSETGGDRSVPFAVGGLAALLIVSAAVICVIRRRNDSADSLDSV